MTVGDFSGISKSTAHGIIHHVSAAIASLRPVYIKFPEAVDDVKRAQTDFYKIASFPRALVAIDCTHVKIKSPEHLFNESHIRTRNCIERMFGIWKRRFPVLALGMRVQLNNVFPIVVATAVLHNILQQRREPVPSFEAGFEAQLPAPWERIIAEGEMGNVVVNMEQQRRLNPEHQERRSIVNQYFTRLVETERQRRQH
nr:unnamed protein product [Callosobruchus analis]